MGNKILIIAHEPLASGFLAVAKHVFGDLADQVVDVVNIAPTKTPENQSVDVLEALNKAQQQQKTTLVLTDVLGASPCNVATFLQTQAHFALVYGLNVPMLLRAMTYRELPLHALVEKVIEGGKSGIAELKPKSDCL